MSALGAKQLVQLLITTLQVKQVSKQGSHARVTLLYIYPEPQFLQLRVVSTVNGDVHC
jgi:hypothetical protein